MAATIGHMKHHWNMRPCRLLCVLAAWAGLADPRGMAANNEITQPFEGVRLIHSKSTVPRQVDMFVVEIDMAAPGLSFLATPSNGALVGDTTPKTTRAFITEVGAQMGINASFFASAGSGQYDVRGLSVSNGDAYSPFESGFLDAINISLGNVATIIRATGASGTAHTPPTSLYNAVGGNTRLVTGGVNVANSDPAIHPRSAAGVTADGKLLLFTVDGRNVGHSEGLTYREMADVLIRWGARDAINLDGGGSTTLVMDNPTTVANDPQVKNIPSDLYPDGQRGKERVVANNLAVFASKPAGPTENQFVYADFEQGDLGPFNSSISFSGSNRGFNTTLSSATIINGPANDGTYAQRLTIIDDPNTGGDTQNPGGAWFVRHVAGGGNPANNVTRPAMGSVGFWAKTSDPNLRISLVVDDASLATGERGTARNMTADGQWHPYFWDINDVSQWEGWVNGDGTVNERFTLDSIQIFGPPIAGSNQNATIDIDTFMHIMPEYLPGDINRDFLVDAADYATWRKGLGTTYTQADYTVWRSQFGRLPGGVGASGAELPSTGAIPEPPAIGLVLLGGFAALAASCTRPRLRRRCG
jgi:hypothetical protein